MWRGPLSSGEGQKGVWDFGAQLGYNLAGDQGGARTEPCELLTVLSPDSEYLMMLMPPSQEEEK